MSDTFIAPKEIGAICSQGIAGVVSAMSKHRAVLEQGFCESQGQGFGGTNGLSVASVRSLFQTGILTLSADPARLAAFCERYGLLPEELRSVEGAVLGAPVAAKPSLILRGKMSPAELAAEFEKLFPAKRT